MHEHGAKGKRHLTSGQCFGVKRESIPRLIGRGMTSLRILPRRRQARAIMQPGKEDPNCSCSPGVRRGEIDGGLNHAVGLAREPQRCHHHRTGKRQKRTVGATVGLSSPDIMKLSARRQACQAM